MTTRTASCQCGQLTATCEGDPVRVSVCHCLNCQRRSGSSFSAQARWPVGQVTISGESKGWQNRGDEGGLGAFHFCPTCGSGVWYMVEAMPDLVAVAIGAFADPSFARPDYSVYETRKHHWVAITSEGTEHYD